MRHNTDRRTQDASFGDGLAKMKKYQTPEEVQSIMEGAQDVYIIKYVFVDMDCDLTNTDVKAHGDPFKRCETHRLGCVIGVLSVQRTLLALIKSSSTASKKIFAYCSVTTTSGIISLIKNPMR